MLFLNRFKSNINICLSKINYGAIFTRSMANTATQTQTTEIKKDVPKVRITTIPKHLSESTDPVSVSNVLIKQEPLFPPMVKPDLLTTTVPFDEVPGPMLLRHIAKIWSVIPVLGTHATTSTIQFMLGSQLSWGRSKWIFRWLLDEYGPIVRLQGPFGGDVVILSRSEDALTVFANEGRYPIRSSLDCIENYRLKYRRYKNAGPFLMHGENWEKLRSQIEIPLQNSIAYQFKKVESVSDDFVLRIRQIRNRQEEVPSNFSEEISKWALECLCSVIIGEKLGFMDQRGNVTTSEPHRLLKAFYGATDAIRKCESGFHLWKFVETPAWKSLIKNCDTIDSILNKHVRSAETAMRIKNQEKLSDLEKNNLPILESLLLQEGIFTEDVLTVFLDMMLIGVNALTHSIAFLLYHLARNQRSQRLLANEIKTSPDSLDTEKLVRLKYLQACIRESLRLKPPMPFLSRILTRDVTIHNYRVPKGTVILMATFLSSLREENFDDALKFIPERWLSQSDIHSENCFASIPFGYGPKACLAKNLAEMQLGVILVKLIKAFKVEYHYGNINTTNKLLAAPDRELKFRFTNRLTN